LGGVSSQNLKRRKKPTDRESQKQKWFKRTKAATTNDEEGDREKSGGLGQECRGGLKHMGEEQRIIRYPAISHHGVVFGWGG